MNSDLTGNVISDLSNRIILADKPLDLTSADVVRIFKREFSIKKIGHSGTLDPRATGLLILCTDKKTKEINDILILDKEYEGTIRIGAVTKSFDTETDEEIITDEININDADIERVRKTFIGEVEQTPPMYSAIKQKGKPLYKLARKGKEVVREPRKIIISEFEVKRINDTELYFRISSSKGTYIRSIANDFGERLGTGGYLKTLRRTRIGNFGLSGLTEELNGIKYRLI
ncbi:MAG TPA: tRNA pseudouridine(55) synthase TruB [Ignavibacteria bacterium]|nr:tRNA pseudouridine(55) synthase TruB [Bacteroidota bacterium]HRI84480.1 tRNA pseudouridine(55) synthase TruB [Ignavibacteria bacterium]HRJ98862.1 tRNA pseudouridine(55) synthase TruB [Ignavibacteria bacterium]